MIRWSYYLLEVSSYKENGILKYKIIGNYLTSSGKRKNSLNSSDGVSKDIRADIDKKIASLGEQGWELIKEEKITDTLSEYHFKRKIGE